MPILRYDVAPTLVICSPMCSGCDTDVESDGDGWQCPICGTSWDYRDGEDERGTLYADWSGEDVSALPLVEQSRRAWLEVAKIVRAVQS